MTKDQIRANLRAMDDDTLWNTLCANTPGGMDASIMSTEEMIEYGVTHWIERGTPKEGLRPATDHEQRVAVIIHGGTDIEVDPDAQAAEGSEGVWVQAWLWISTNDLKEFT